MVKVMFGVVAATLLGFSCRADAWGGKKDEVRGACQGMFVPCTSVFVGLQLALPCMIMIRTRATSINLSLLFSAKHAHIVEHAQLCCFAFRDSKVGPLREWFYQRTVWCSAPLSYWLMEPCSAVSTWRDVSVAHVHMSSG